MVPVWYTNALEFFWVQSSSVSVPVQVGHINEVRNPVQGPILQPPNSGWS